jgi:hypothetical protein
MGPCFRRDDGFEFRTALHLQTEFHDLAACFARSLLERPALGDQRAQGMPGARCAR